MFTEAIKPLEDYLLVYDKYDSVLKLNAEQYIKDMGKDEESSKTVVQIRDEIYEHMEKEKNMMAQVPDIINVSCFEIHCKEARASLAGKHSEFTKALTEVIA